MYSAISALHRCFKVVLLYPQKKTVLTLRDYLCYNRIWYRVRIEQKTPAVIITGVLSGLRNKEACPMRTRGREDTKNVISERVRALTMTAFLCAFVCVLSPFSIQVGPIPLTLASFAIYIVAAVSPPPMASGALFLYIFLGSLGMPVFSGFEGGVGKLTGPTGGYIVGFFILALSASSIIGVLGRRKWSFPFAMTVGTILLYAFGTAWYSIYTGIGFAESAAACVLPFLLPDAVKITAASVIGISLDSRRALSRYLRRERRDDRRD